MSQLELRTAQVGPWQMNTYALVCPETQQSVLIDPGADPDVLAEMLADSTPMAIWLTHTHPDHIGALEEMQKRLNVPLLAHPGPHSGNMVLHANEWVNHGDILEVGNYSLQVYYTPGHIGDHICFSLLNDHRIVVGDTIFEGGPGRTWSAEGFQTTLETLKNIVLKWPDDTVCYPGHGPHFRLGNKRAAIQAFVKKDHGDFYGDATWNM